MSAPADHVRLDADNAPSVDAPILSPPPREPSVSGRLAALKSATNPLLEAAQPLLRALADMPSELSEEGMHVFHALLDREVTTFHALGRSARLRHEHVIAASYALCTALDEAANGTAWGGGRGAEGGPWAARRLAAHFHGDTQGGDKVFLLLGRLAACPDGHIDLLEVLHRILGLGFEGRFGGSAHGRRQLEAIRHRLLIMLVAARGEVPRDLSPHWRGAGASVGVGVKRFRMLRGLPAGVTAVILALCLVALFGGYRYRLERASAELVPRILAIGALRPPPAPPAPPAQSPGAAR